MWVDGLSSVVGFREAVDWENVAVTVVDDDQVWDGTLKVGTVYKKLVDLRGQHPRRLRIGRGSKRWWDKDLSRQAAVVKGAQCRCVRLGNRNAFAVGVIMIKKKVQEKKDHYWRTFCTKSGLQSLWKVIWWVTHPWRVWEQMGKLR